MALIKCKECGNVISDKATTCPRCGNPVNNGAASYQGDGATRLIKKKSPNSKWLFTTIAVLGIALLGCGAYILLDKNSGVGTEPAKAEVTGAKTDSVAPKAGVVEAKEEVKSKAEVDALPSSTPVEEQTAPVAPPKTRGIHATLTGWISTIEDVKMVLRGTTGTLSYVMDGKRIVSNIVMDASASKIDEDGFGHLVLKSFTPNGKLKGRFIGEMDPAECGYFYGGQFINVNGGSTNFLLTE